MRELTLWLWALTCWTARRVYRWPWKTIGNVVLYFTIETPLIPALIMLAYVMHMTGMTFADFGSVDLFWAVR